MIIPSPTPTCGARSPCSPIPTRCALSTVSTSSPVIDAVTTRAPRSRTPPISRPWSSKNMPPASKTLLIRAAERGSNLGSITGAMLRLLDRYGAAELQAAIIEAIDRNVPHPSAVRLALERRRHERQQLPPVAANLPDHVQARDVAVRPPRLELYDQLKRTSDE